MVKVKDLHYVFMRLEAKYNHFHLATCVNLALCERIIVVGTG